MPDVYAIAAREYRAKLQLERQLRAALRPTLRQFAHELAATFRATGQIPQLNPAQVEAHFLDHYLKVQDKFEGRSARTLKLGLRPSEAGAIRQQVGLQLQQRAEDAARQVISTTYKVMQKAVDKAAETRAKILAEGKVVTPTKELDLVLGNFRQSIPRRTALIAANETNYAAELVKHVEATSLSSSSGQLSYKRVWVTQGDSRVRPSHLTADSQEQGPLTPFLVGGSLLMYPGDQSLGAPLEEVVNCRCATVLEY